MAVERIPSGHLTPLLTRYTRARFVLMYAAYPYHDELVGIAKHFPNVWVDLCWAWSIDPYTTADCFRRFLHAVPINKLFAFGGDTRWPNAALAYSVQARRWLTHALSAEVAEGWVTEPSHGCGSAGDVRKPGRLLPNPRKTGIHSWSTSQRSLTQAFSEMPQMGVYRVPPVHFPIMGRIPCSLHRQDNGTTSANWRIVSVPPVAVPVPSDMAFVMIERDICHH